MEPNILRLSILEMIRMRKGKSFCPSEVVRWLYPMAWRHFMSDIREEMMQMYREGLITVTQKEEKIDPENDPKGPVRISEVR
ncbi:DUF3253 domain-containing protein [Arthrospiribacter ruber]|uniref:DUF3253 domain-containing protein n=1 Tax=Arthrospiribacter ruber TaxID=2487934 RepID=A0A951IRS3_9BACT|nr:DUF3253 domain-containing protein [Arthrospiribacter ruber]